MVQDKGEPVIIDNFYTDGRGPELIKVHWALSGATLKAIDFINPDKTELMHLFFTKVQVLMFTPEEVINYVMLNPAWKIYRSVGIICLGKSSWLNSFSPRHLEKCLHYQIMFYDELLDVICEKIEVRDGGYLADNS
jgi:hypothetical protein